MDAAKRAVAQFTSKTGHSTEVHESVLPAVTRETIKPTRHEIITEAVDKEIHQHHYHTTVQPLSHTETLPANHVHNLVPVKHVAFQHEDKEQTRARVAAELAIFKHSSVVAPTVHTNSVGPAVIGEHWHHHVHERVIPIIHKETVKPEIIHTTLPIHETHHHEPVHHGMSQMTARTLEEFTKLGGVLTGSKAPTREQYSGPPRAYLKELETSLEKLGFHHNAHTTNGVQQSGTLNSTPNTALNQDSRHIIQTDARHGLHQNGTRQSRPAALDTVTPTTTTTTTTRRNHSQSSNSTVSTASLPATPKNQRFSDHVPIRDENIPSLPSSPTNRNSADVNSKRESTGFLGKMRSSRERERTSVPRAAY